MLTPAQKDTLKAAIQADATANALLVDGNLPALADWCNALEPGPYIVWKTAVPQDEVMLNGFDWARVDNLSIGKARIWEWLFANEARSINPSKPNIRAGIDATWVGTAADLAVRAAVYVHCKRSATRLEKIFASGSGTDASPSVMAVEGEIYYAEFFGPPFQG